MSDSSRLVPVAIALAAMAGPVAAQAQTATNTVNVNGPSGLTDPVAANNSATDSDTIIVAPSAGPGTMSYATSGNGLHQTSIAILDWSTSSIVDGIQNGDVVNFALTGCRTGTLTATFSNVVNAGAMDIRDMETWVGSSAFQAYNGPGAGEAIHTIVDDLGFTINWSLIVGGQAQPLDLIFFDAEATNVTNESITATTNGGGWALIENVGGTGYTIAGVGSQTISITQTEGPSNSPVLLTKSASRTDVSIVAGGNQAVAFGVLLPCDYSDAPASYGSAAHAFREDAASSGLGLVADASQPILGTGIDPEFSAQPSVNADGDDTDTQGDDENGVSTFQTLTRATTTYTLPAANFTVSGSGNLYGWVDFDGNGTFDTDEFASTTVTGGVPASDLVWAGVSGVTSGASTYVRLRFTADTLTASGATATAGSGEVEDYLVTLTTAVDLALTKTNTPGVNGEVDQLDDTLISGSTTTYTIRVTNTGPDDAVGAILTDTPGAGLTCDAASPVTITGDGVPAGSFTIADLTGAGITLGTLSTGQTTTLSYSCQVN
ncbi:CshA/CshB family fibrillar adhesin-related protein [Erythrobacter sp. EC-HK427]|uniref:CshA/CshB family fibrillar adhesin-related protein n=1 Tax=Erythrobacter sp. EC-HK427 TaxID=2038396 RepID=UPI00125FF224|nr:CshA/CshB family fibrillar adhesin-related protein [Erythrobacter sp. EC-HK427]